MAKSIFIALLYVTFAVADVNSQVIATINNYGSFHLSNALNFFDDSVFIKTIEEFSKIDEYEKNENYNDYFLFHQAVVDYSKKYYKLADSKLETLIHSEANSPLRARAAILRAFIMFEQKKYDMAQELFEHAKNIAEDEFRVRGDAKYNDISNYASYWRGVALAQTGKYQESQNVFLENYSKYPDGIYADDALFALGMNSEVNRQFESAINYYRTIQKKFPYSNSVLIAKVREANDNLILRDPVSALITIESANLIIRHLQKKDSVSLKYEHQSHYEHIAEELLYLQGETYNLTANFEKSESYFTAFLETFSVSYLKDYVNLGYAWSLLNQNINGEAIDIYAELLKNEEDKESRVIALAKLYRAIAFKRNGDIEQSKKEFLNIIAQSDFTFNSQALLELGQIYYEEAEYEKAVKTLDRAEREASEGLVQVRVQLLMASAYMELKDWTKAIKHYKNTEQMALKANYIFMPQKDYYLSESRLKMGMAFVRNSRNSEAIAPLLAYLSNDKNTRNRDIALFWLAEAYYRSDLLNNAIDRYSSLIDQFPKSDYREESLYGLGWSYFRLKNFNKSSETFERMTNEFPDTKYGVEVFTRQGDGYYVTKNFRKAVEAYRKATKLAPTSEEGQYSSYQAAHALYQMNSYEEAISALFTFVRSYPRSPYASNALYLTGWIRFQQHKYSECIDDFRYLIQAYPNSVLVPRAYFAIADAFYNSGDFNSALTEYKRVVDDFPASQLAPEAIKSMQYCYNALGMPEEAVKIADRYVESNPDSPYAPEFIFKKGEMFYSGKNYGDAVTEYNNFLKKYPDSDKNSEAMFWMAKSYLNLDDLPNAEKTFLGIIQKFPKSDYASLSMLELGLLKKQAADIKEADEIFSKIQIEYPDDPIAAQAGFERATIKFALGDSTEAISLFKAVASKYPDTDYGEQSIYKTAMYYRLVGNYQESINEFTKLLKSNLNAALAAEAQFRIGEIKLRQTNIEGAIEAFVSVKENFAGLEDWYTLSMLNLGDCYEKTGQIEKAIETYQGIVSLRPDDDFGKTAKRRLKDLEK